LVMFQTMAAVKVGYYGLRHVRSDLFVHLQRLSLAYHRARPQGDPLYRMTNDSFGFPTILNIVVGNVLVSVVTLVVMAWIMFRIHWREVVYTMLVATILGLGVAVILGLGGYLVYRDEFVHAAKGFTAGDLILFLMYLGKFYDPLNKITGSGSTFGQAVVQAK